jgi:hypothetical protein
VFIAHDLLPGKRPLPIAPQRLGAQAEPVRIPLHWPAVRAAP